jgi:hypothetical protein
MARCPANGAEVADYLHRLRAAQGVVVAGRCRRAERPPQKGSARGRPRPRCADEESTAKISARRRLCCRCLRRGGKR